MASVLSSDRRPNELSRRDWLEAGQARLRREGLKGLKLRALAADLGVSTGSFYHHFGDFDAYERALADYFAHEQLAEVVARPEVLALPPLERVRELIAFVLRNELSRLALAMRAWGESSAVAKAAVRAHDKAITAYLRTALNEMGFGEEEAMVRAYALIAFGHAHIHSDLPIERLREGLIRLTCLTPSVVDVRR
jgi:AcrR family transcriptional regulator